MESIQEGFLEKVISVPSSEDTPANSAGSCPQGTRGGAGASWTLKKENLVLETHVMGTGQVRSLGFMPGH